jgi:polysaccharide biosynthesis protein PslH
MEKINVLSLVSYKILPAKMGGQKGIALFNEYLAKEVNLTCVSTKNNDTSLANGYNMLNILSDSKLRYVNIFYFFLIKRIIKANNITHLIIEHPYLGWLGFLLKIFCKIKLIVHSHNIEALRFKSTGKWWWKILWQYEKWAYTKANAVFFITSEDLKYAVKYFNIDEQKCTVVTYGIEIDKIPTITEKENARLEICKTHSINAADKILLFNGTLDYGPNLDAVKVILEKINPILLEASNFKYKVVICGKGLPANYNELKDYSNKNIIYAGFVNDITTYFLGADIFINPVIDGGGIKTKLVEALGYNVSVVSTVSGAIGVPLDIVESKMCVVEDNDWEGFGGEIISINVLENTPMGFFEWFYWGEIVRKAAISINGITINK